MKNFSIIFSICFLFALTALAQTDSDKKKLTNDSLYKVAVAKINANKSANVKDVLTPYLRAGIDNLLGDNHSFTLNSSFYSIDSIFKNRFSKRFSSEKFLRENSFNIGLSGDSVNNVVKFSLGFTFTIINKKDMVYKPFSETDKNELQAVSIFKNVLRKTITNYYAGDDNAISEVREYLNESSEKHNYSKENQYINKAFYDQKFINVMLDSASIRGIQKEVVLSALEDIMQGKDPAQALFDNITLAYSKKPLWTFKPNASYDRINKQGDYVFESTFTTGLGKKLSTKPWEFEANLKLTISSDSTVRTANYKKKPLSLSIGVNKVLIQNSDKESKMEFKVFTQYAYKLGSFVSNRDEFSFNSTLRINVYKSLWLPVTIKYDAKKGNVFGFFAITANIGS